MDFDIYNALVPGRSAGGKGNLSEVYRDILFVEKD
jgi:hypothetical protein